MDFNIAMNNALLNMRYAEGVNRSNTDSGAKALECL